jgi:hypothetical protein
LAGSFDFTEVGFAFVSVGGDGVHGDVGSGGVQDEADQLGVRILAGQGEDTGAVGVGPGLLGVDAAAPDAVAELSEDHVGLVDLVAGGGEVLPDRAEVSASVVGVFQQPGGVRLVRIVAGAGVLAQFGPEERVNGSGVDEVGQAVGEVLLLGAAGEPDGQPPGGDVVDDGAAVVGFGDAVVDELLVQVQVGQRRRSARISWRSPRRRLLI